MRLAGAALLGLPKQSPLSYSNRRRWDSGEWNVSTFFKFDVGDCQINIWRDVEDKLVNHAKKVEMTT